MSLACCEICLLGGEGDFEMKAYIAGNRSYQFGAAREGMIEGT
jgi:hypothetical protein